MALKTPLDLLHAENTLQTYQIVKKTQDCNDAIDDLRHLANSRSIQSKLTDLGDTF